jgi:ADP-ribose pyrophosphatase YjhB (NUDIX family)
VEPGETFEQALIREAREEIDVTPMDYRVAGCIADPNSGEPVTYHMYAVADWEGDPHIIDDEHSELRWFSLEEAAGLTDLALKEYRALFEVLGSAHT